MKLSLRFTPVLWIILLISLAGSLAIFLSTSWGPWAYSDSTEYIVSARNLLAGHGLGYPAPSGSWVPYTLHPPLYPLLLSAFGLLGIDLITAARWINVVLFGLTIFLSGACADIIYRSSWLAVCISLSILTLPVLVDVSSGAMSELPFIFFTILTIGLLGLFTGVRRIYLLILTSLAAGLAALIRYPGIVVVGTGMLGLLFAGKFSLKQRFQNILLFSVISLTPIALWLVQIFRLAGNVGARTYAIPSALWADTIELRKKFTEVFWSWLPYQQQLPVYRYRLGRLGILVLIFLIIILASLILFKRLRNRTSPVGSTLELHFSLMWMIFTLGSIALLGLTYLFTNPVPDVNPRTLLPVQVGLVMVLLTLLGALVNTFHLPHAVGWGFACLVVILAIPNAMTSWKMIDNYRIFGSGYTDHNWRSSLTLKYLQALPTDVPIITNESSALLLLLNRPAYDFCSLPCNQSEQIRYGDDLSDPTQQLFHDRGAALALFYPYCGVQNEQWYATTLDQLNLLTQDLRRAFSSCDGAVYYYPSAGSN